MAYQVYNPHKTLTATIHIAPSIHGEFSSCIISFAIKIILLEFCERNIHSGCLNSDMLMNRFNSSKLSCFLVFFVIKMEKNFIISLPLSRTKDGWSYKDCKWNRLYKVAHSSLFNETLKLLKKRQRCKLNIAK